MGLFKNRVTGDHQKSQKFSEFEKDYVGSPLTLATVKAAWLTSRANHNGQTGNTDEAIKDFKEAIKINPNHCPAYLGLAVAYRVKGIFDEAINTLEQAPKLTTIGESKLDNRFEIYYHLGFVYIEKDDVKNAIVSFNSAINLDKSMHSVESVDEEDEAERNGQIAQMKEWISENR